MTRLFTAGLIACLSVSAVVGADAVYGTIDGWGQMIDPDGDSRFEVGRDGVTVVFGRGRHGLDAEGGPQKMNAPRVLRSVDGDFSVSTIVKGNLPLPEIPYAYVSGGLVLMQDAQNYIRLERASFIRQGQKSYYTNFEQRIDAKRTRMGRFADFRIDAERDIQLRLEVEGENVRALARHVGEDWHEMGTATIETGRTLHAGVSGVKTIDEEARVTFTDFMIDRDPSIDASESSEIDLSQPERSVALPQMPNPALMKLLPKINELQARANQVEDMSDEETDHLIRDAKELASEKVDGLPQPLATGIAQGLADSFRRAGKPHTSVRVYREFAELLGQMDDQSESDKSAISLLRALADRLQSKLELIGKPISVEGILMNGEPINWTEYEGKVVLVDFWASWCGPCRREIPNIKDQYETYHERGFEVIGVCLDREREKAEEYIKSAEIPWSSIFDQDAQEEPMAKRYDITSIPTAILVDREGKIVSIEARGETLPTLLNQMFEQVGGDTPEDFEN